MSDVERHSGVRNATILLLITSALQIQAGYSFLQFAIIMTYPLNSIFGIFMIGLGVLSLCTSKSNRPRADPQGGSVVFAQNSTRRFCDVKA